MSIMPDSLRIDLALGTIRILIQHAEDGVERMTKLLEILDVPEEERERAVVAVYAMCNTCRAIAVAVESGEDDTL